MKKHVENPVYKLEIENKEGQQYLHQSFGYSDEKADEIATHCQACFDEWRDSEEPLPATVYLEECCKIATNPTELVFIGVSCMLALEHSKRRDPMQEMLESLRAKMQD
jgi:hypothetical protein